MKGPIRLVRSEKIPEYKNLGPIFEWSEGKAYLIIDNVSFKGKPGAILCYCNPPVHQVGNPGLDAYLEGLNKVLEKRDNLEFLIIYGANDPVHAGGDLKESLNKLDITLKTKKEKESAGAPAEEIDLLFDWADNRLKKGIALHGTVRKIAQYLRVVAVCGGGTRFGGSAEIPLMADYLVGDSRSGMCFSEAMIGLIPGWAGIARTLIKAGPINAEYMAMTSKEVKADNLKGIGTYNEVVDIPFPFPKRQKTGDREADKANYLEALETHNDDTGLLLLPKALIIATCPEEEVPKIDEKERLILATKEEVLKEVVTRKDPENYSHLWGKPLREVKDEIAGKGRPLAPQSIDALNRLLEDYDPLKFDEIQFVEREMKADARLYRDTKFRAGLVATLEQSIADYREA
ncbi:MAG: enoyl-CoA hydratase/isomerase family protein [Deltaproteobacteria bacterium]|nr:enoyl-CoA hydratase/isomerase family protein [Deltaproteobacteria bacterium]MBW2116734.1 enoyl-CoA hydratase/isomerase family protein [Deltaproteobacteria bacterium]MBW2344689.1 enoyl-CoA hydratase/isomerase family protein [Deltaproteobacteria bacterium]